MILSLMQKRAVAFCHTAHLVLLFVMQQKDVALLSVMQYKKSDTQQQTNTKWRPKVMHFTGACCGY